MRILVTTNAAVGHFLPMAPTVAELMSIGHDVRVGCPESFAPFLRKTGFDALPCRETNGAVPVTPPPPGTDRQALLMWAVTRSWPSDCRTWVVSLLDQAARWRPDLVIVEPVEHAGRVVAAALGTPLVVHGWGFTLPAGVDESATAGISDLYDALSATPSAPSMTIDLGPASLQAADAALAHRFRYRPFAVPGQMLPPTKAGKRRVLVTLGTYGYADAAPLLRAAVQVALDADAEVVAVSGGQDQRADEPSHPDVTMLNWVDMAAAMRTCDLVIHHGGSGTSWTALSCGTPAVVLPLGGDQFRNAHLLAAAGTAIVCPSHQHDALPAAVTSALNDSHLADRAEAVAGENMALPDISELARRLSSLTDARTH